MKISAEEREMKMTNYVKKNLGFLAPSVKSSNHIYDF